MKKTRSRKKVEAPLPDQEQGIVMQAELRRLPALDPPKRRRKKTPETVVEEAATEFRAPSSMKGEEASGSSPAGDAVSPTKPKRTRRVGEPKLKRYAVGEPETERNA